MDILSVQNQIRDLLEKFSQRVRLENVSDRYDINRLSESIMLPILRLLYDLKDLRNVNYTHAINYPGIDLGDKTAKIAFQITSTSNNEKIKHTLKTIKAHHLDKTYQRFVVYILTNKQGKYADKDYAVLDVEFLKDRDIWDYTDLCKTVSEISDVHVLRKVLRYLEDTVGRGQPFKHRPDEAKTEPLELNFIKIEIPKDLYLAKIKIDRDDFIEAIQARDKAERKKYRPAFQIPDRDVVCQYFDENLIGYPKDFICSKKQIITFHNLTDDEHPYYSAIDPRTIEKTSFASFIADNAGGVDESRERLLKELVGRCLTRFLVPLKVSWHHREKLYFFTLDDESEEYDPFHNVEKSRYERIEQWKEKRSTHRFVSFRRYKKDQPEEIAYYFHLAFKTKFHVFGDECYLEITPDWHASIDGYRNSTTFYDRETGEWRTRRIQFLSEKVKEQKERENNLPVFNHFRFIRTFLRRNFSPLLKKTGKDFFIEFGADVQLHSSPILEDKIWNPDYDKSEADTNAENSDETKPRKKRRRKKKAAAKPIGKFKNPNQNTLFDLEETSL
jgi:hypothetical protein